MAKSVGAGQITFTGYVAGANNISFSDVIATHDSTAFSDYPYEVFETGHKVCDITANLFHDTQNTAAVGDKALLVAQYAANQVVYGTASLISRTLGVPVKGLTTMDYAFKFYGTFQYSG